MRDDVLFVFLLVGGHERLGEGMVGRRDELERPDRAVAVLADALEPVDLVEVAAHVELRLREHAELVALPPGGGQRRSEAAHDDRVDVERLDLGHHRAEFALARWKRLLVFDLAAEFRERLFGAVDDAAAVFLVLHQQREALVAALLHGVMAEHPALHVGDARPAEHGLVAFHDADRIGIGGDHRHFRFADDGRGRDAGEAERAADDRDHLVLLDQLARDRDGFRAVAAVVVDDELDLAAVDPAGRIGLLHGKLGALLGVDAEAGEPLGDRTEETDLDRLLCMRRGLGADEQQAAR